MSTDQSAINLDRDVNVHFEDREKSRIFYVFLWLLYAIVFLTKNCFNGALSDIVTEGLMTKSQTGLITGLFYLVYAPGQIVGGLVSDRVSPERLIKIGLLGSALSNAIIFFNQNYYVMCGAWMFNAAAQFALWPSIFKIISSQLVRSDRKQMVFGISFSGTAGLVMSYLLAACVTDWRYNFAVSAVLLILFAVALHILSIRLSPHLKWDRPQTPSFVPTHINTSMTTGQVFASSGLFLVLAATLLNVLVSQSCSSLAPIMFVENYESISPSLGNLLNIFLLSAGILGAIIANRFVRRIKNYPSASAVCSLLMLPCCALCPMVGKIPIPAMVILLCLISCFYNAIALFKSYYTTAFVSFGKNGAAAGIINAAVSVSYMLSAYLIPLIQESIGWSLTLCLWSVFIAISIPLFSIAGRKYSTFTQAN